MHPVPRCPRQESRGPDDNLSTQKEDTYQPLPELPLASPPKDTIGCSEMSQKQSTEDLRREQQGIRTETPDDCVKANGFPRRDVVQIMKKPATQQQPENQQLEPEQRNHVLCLPYVKGVSEKIERSCKNLNIKTAFKPTRTL